MDIFSGTQYHENELNFFSLYFAHEKFELHFFSLYLAHEKFYISHMKRHHNFPNITGKKIVYCNINILKNFIDFNNNNNNNNSFF